MAQGGMLDSCVPACRPHWGLIHRRMHLPVPIFQGQGAMRCVKAPMGWGRVVRKGLGGDRSGSVNPQLFFLFPPSPSEPHGTEAL